MENSLAVCSRGINHLDKLIEILISKNGENPLARGDRKQISSFKTNYDNFNKHTSNPSIDAETAIDSAKNAAIHAQALGAGINSKDMYSEDIKGAARDLATAAIALINNIDSGRDFTGPYMTTPIRHELINEKIDNAASSFYDHEKQIIELQAKIRSEIETFERDISKGTDEIEKLKQKSTSNYKNSSEEILELLRTIEQLKSNISNLNEQMVTESGKAAKISVDAEEHSKKVHARIDDLLGQTASKVLIVDYANTAEAEKKSANQMRFWSLLCMALTGGILCVALYESLSSPLDWKQSVLKVFTAIALSVPAAYLARESAKHRNQEHINRRISLDLRAITPYIATLPSEEQNKIKSEVASKIFGAQESSNTAPDNYPINFQELVKAVIEKIPTPK